MWQSGYFSIVPPPFHYLWVARKTYSHTHWLQGFFFFFYIFTSFFLINWYRKTYSDICIFSFSSVLVWEILDTNYTGSCFDPLSWITHDQTYWTDTNTQSLFLTALRQHTDSYIYGLPHQLEDVWEGLCDLLSLQCGHSTTFLNLMWHNIKMHLQSNTVSEQLDT